MVDEWSALLEREPMLQRHLPTLLEEELTPKILRSMPPKALLAMLEELRFDEAAATRMADVISSAKGKAAESPPTAPPAPSAALANQLLQLPQPQRQAPPNTSSDVKLAPVRDLDELFAEANVSELVREQPLSLSELQHVRLQAGRSALLSRLKDFGLPLPARQKVAQTFAAASRQGRVPTQLTPPEPPKATAVSQGKIAFLFLIYDEIHHEELWHTFLGGAPRGTEQYSVHVHAKSRSEGAPLHFFEHCHLPPEMIVPTKYADLSLVRAMNALLRHALADANNQKFVFLSGHCLPVKPFAHVYATLLADDKAFFSEMDVRTGNDQGLRRTLQQATRGSLDPKRASKAAQWSVLNKRVARLCAEASLGWTSAFHGVRAPEEWFYLSTARRDAEQPADVHAVSDDASGNHRGPTFANWMEQEYSPGGHRPRTYQSINIDELHALVHGPTCFARKFASGCTGLEQLYELHRQHRCSGADPDGGATPIEMH